MKKFITNKHVLTILGFILFLAIWEIISLIVDQNNIIFPGVFNTFKEMFILLTKPYVYKCLGYSFYRMAIGFVIAFSLAFVLGIIASSHQIIRKLLEPSIVALKSIPTAALVFLFLVITGAKNAPIYMVILVSFPILYESVVGGITNISPSILDASTLDGGNNFKGIFKVKVPLAFPYIVVGLASSFGLAFKIEIMSEIISGDTRYGLGSAILAASKNDPSNMVPIFAYSLIAIIFILIVTYVSKLFKQNNYK